MNLASAYWANSGFPVPPHQRLPDLLCISGSLLSVGRLMLTRTAEPVPAFRPTAREGQLAAAPALLDSGSGAKCADTKGHERLCGLLLEHGDILDFISSMGDLPQSL